MSAYQPPTENLPIFNAEVFEDSNSALIQDTLASSVYTYPQQWIGSNYWTFNSFLTNPTLSGASQTCFVKMPSLSYSTTPAWGVSITLEITYTITSALAPFNWLTAGTETAQIYNGYSLTTIQFSPNHTNAGLAGGWSNNIITNTGNMFFFQTIQAPSGQSASMTPVSIDYASQSDINGIEITFGDCSLPTPTNETLLTSFNRSVRIVNGYATYPNSSGIPTQMTIPNDTLQPMVYFESV
tara:strand:+ start:1099 stop:1818 length:720 start_codon:yes stop_codon:yes gene_type:complete